MDESHKPPGGDEREIGGRAAHGSGGDRLAVWEFAGLMLTYWCNASCAFCYVCAGPRRGGKMDVGAALDLWRGLDRLSDAHGKTMRIHLAGGEPFGDWPHLVSILRAARDAGLSPVEKVETNAFWATSEGLTRARLELLSGLGVERLIVSWDIFHAEFVPFERVRRCVEAARRVFGRGGVTVRWWDFFQRPVDIRRMSAAEKEEAFRAALERHADRLTGRAALRLAHLRPRRPASAFRGQRCCSELLGSRHVHVDPFGNIFPGTCGGIILGRCVPGVVASGQHVARCDAEVSGTPPPASTDIEEVWRELADNWPSHPVIAALVAGGSYELLERVRHLGYRELPGGYADKCHLCASIRQFLVCTGVWSEWVGPRECYESTVPA